MRMVNYVRAALGPTAEQFQVNKYIRVALSATQAVIGFLLLLGDNINWVGLTGAKAGAAIVMAIGLFKVFYGSLAPSADKSTVPTGNPIITHVTPEGHTQPQV